MTILSTPSASLPFLHPERVLGAMSSDAAAGLVAAASDIAIVLDRHGLVQDLSVSSDDLVRSGIGDWRGQAWIDTVESDIRPKVADMLKDAAAGQVSRWREINHPGEFGASVPVRYFALGGGDDGRVIVIGRDLQASAVLQQRLLQVQQSVERDYLRLRQAESRYRLLFQSASEAVLILDAATRRIKEANPAVCRLTGLTDATVAGQAFLGLLDPASVEVATRLLNAATSVSTPDPAPVMLVDGTPCLLAASMFRQDRSASLLVRLMTDQPVVAASDPQATLSAVLDRISDAFVVTDTDLRILTVNPAFLELTHLSSREEATRLSLDQFLGRPQIDLKIMLTQLKEHGTLRNFSTVLRAGFGEMEEVEVSAVSVPDDTQPTYGFSIRNVARRLAPAQVPGTALPQSIEQLTQLIGRVPMKEIVRESTDLIEKLCIEAALNLTSDNRASAADVLGLSRQSLYSKLRRYGLGNLDDIDE
ncbi:MAG: transcriptional regulator PpsR [Alphaproteobacteria bacterium]|nr:MAG: transcriptional regulator PpsR [Alphaproteobacteria bacterium]